MISSIFFHLQVLKCDTDAIKMQSVGFYLILISTERDTELTSVSLSLFVWLGLLASKL